jgi:hypothetical protein
MCTWGGPVKFSWILALLLLGTVVCAASVPPVDDPDTAVDESEFQVIFLVPSPLSIKSVPVFASSLDGTRPVSLSQNLTTGISYLEFMRVLNSWHSLSFQKLFCTLLI